MEKKIKEDLSKYFGDSWKPIKGLYIEIDGKNK